MMLIFYDTRITNIAGGRRKNFGGKEIWVKARGPLWREAKPPNGKTTTS